MDGRRRGSFVVPDLSLAMPHDAPDQRASSGEGAERAVVPTSATNNDAHMTSETTSLQSAGTSPPSIPEHELFRRIGGGSYGEVWLARSQMGSYRAVKIVHRRTFEHDRPFEREYSGIQKFEPISRSHEGLVDLLQVGRNDQEGYFYYVMELADDAGAKRSDGVLEIWSNGQASPAQHSIAPPLQYPDSYVPRTLKLDLSRRGRLTCDECVRLGLALTSALSHLHKHGLVHRDIKPSNIIFVEGVPKLADVGLVAPVGEAQSYVGTEGFIPPEGPGSPQADLYSLGIVLYVMSTGKSHSDFPEPLPDLSSDPDHARWLEFNAVVHKACQAEVSERYQRAEEMQADLTLLQMGKSVRQKRVADRRWAVGRRFGAVAAALAVLVGALVQVNVLKHVKPPNPEAVRLYGLGQWHQNQLTDASLKKAIEYLNQAIQIDPKYIPPYTALFGIYMWGVQGISREERAQNVKQIAGRMLSLAPNLAESHAALSCSKYLEGNFLGAEEEIRRALKLDPDYAIAYANRGDTWGSAESLPGSHRRAGARSRSSTLRPQNPGTWLRN